MSFLVSRRFWITSATSALVSLSRLAKRAWIFEKSLLCCLLISPRTEFMSSWAVTMIHARPWHLVARLSATVCRLVISGVLGDVLTDFIDEEVEAEVGRLFVEPGLDLIAEVFDETLYWARYLSRIPLAIDGRRR